MNKLTLFILVFTISFFSFSQSASVEKSIFGIQTGLLGLWVHNEARLSNEIALRFELGFDTGVYGSDIYDIQGVLFVPTITIDPRWYYNLIKRVSKSKRIDGNSGNFISIKTTYHPDWFFISSEENIDLISDISIIPTWGIRRNIGNHFNYEVGAGVGYVHYFMEDGTFSIDSNEVGVNLHLRIGYRF